MYFFQMYSAPSYLVGGALYSTKLTLLILLSLYITFNERDVKMATRNSQVKCPSTDNCENWVKPGQRSVTGFLGGEVGREEYFNLFVFNYKFHALAIFSGLPEHENKLLSILGVLIPFKNSSDCTLLNRTLENSICSVLIRIRGSWR